MIVLTCPDCYSSHVERCEGMIQFSGRDFFNCLDCRMVFELKDASYRVEPNIYEH